MAIRADDRASAGTAGLMASLFSVFKAGLLVFGGGLVIIPLLERQVVERGWLDPTGFLDGVAIGQISPGPVVLTSSFVGYQAGWADGDLPSALLGAAAATLGIFLPSFLFILVGTPILRRLRQQPRSKPSLRVNGRCSRGRWRRCLAVDADRPADRSTADTASALCRGLESEHQRQNEAATADRHHSADWRSLRMVEVGGPVSRRSGGAHQGLPCGVARRSLGGRRQH